MMVIAKKKSMVYTFAIPLCGFRQDDQEFKASLAHMRPHQGELIMKRRKTEEKKNKRKKEGKGGGKRQETEKEDKLKKLPFKGISQAYLPNFPNSYRKLFKICGITFYYYRLNKFNQFEHTSKTVI